MIIDNKKTTKKNVFTKKHFNAGDGMLTTVWGPSLWHYLHIMSFNYPINPTSKDKKYYREQIINLQYTLPCRHCRENLSINLKNKPIQMCDMKNRETYSRFIYELHERINKQLNKKSGLSYCDVRERYENFRERCTTPSKFKFTKKNHKGCTESLYGKKAKCLIKIVPQNNKSKTLSIDKKCMKSKLSKTI